MLFLLRQLRRLELRKRSSRYFLYAAGEIILVVVGILIALQINNSNEAKKDREFEVKMLASIQKNLQADFEHVDGFMTQRNEAVVGAVEFFENSLITGELDKTKASRQLGFLATGFTLQFNAGAYQALKSTGIDKISSDKVRDEIIQLYEYEYPRMYQFVEFQKEMSQRYADEYLPKFLSARSPTVRDGKVNYQSGKLKIQDLLNDPDFLRELTFAKSRTMAVNNLIKSYKDAISKLIALIEEEIKDEI